MNVKKLLIRLAFVIAAVAAGLIGFVLSKKPDAVPPRSGKFTVTPERLARGKYLFHTVAQCADCHSPRDWSKYLGPADPKRIAQGSLWPVEEDGAKLVAPNLTPDPETGLGNWTDGEKLRAIREGVSRDGSAIFPMMPYSEFRNLSDEDAESIVVYMNTLEPGRNPLPKSQYPFPARMAIKWIPKPVAGQMGDVDRSDRAAYGKHLVSIGSCLFCHTPGERGPDLARSFSGGREFGLSSKLIVRSANISPDMETGIGKWSEQRFFDRFAEFREYSREGAQVPIATPANFTVMHWTSLANMKDDDIRAMYAYLRTVPAQVNKVEIRPPSSQAR